MKLARDGAVEIMMEVLASAGHVGQMDEVVNGMGQRFKWMMICNNMGLLFNITMRFDSRIQ